MSRDTVKRPGPSTATGRQQGFSLLEALVAIVIGAIVLGTASVVVNKSLQAADLVLVRVEMQQDGRAAINSILKDLSQAGTGLDPGGIQLPSGVGATLSLHGCSAAACYLKNNTFPNNHLYYAFPDPGDNQVQRGSPDALVVTYADRSISLGTVPTVPATGSADINPAGSQVNLVSVTGVRIGDLIMLKNVHGAAVGMVTNIIPATNTLVFGAADALNINQPGAAGGNIASLRDPGTNNYPTTTASRILLISYYLQQGAGPDGSFGTNDDTFQLMRQVNGQAPSPVMDGVENIQFTYDVYDDTAASPGTTLLTNTKNANNTPSLIRKINVVMSVRSARIIGLSKDFTRMTLAVSVSPRNLSFRDRYQ